MFWKHCRLNSAESEIDMTQRDRGTQYERVQQKYFFHSDYNTAPKTICFSV